VVEPNEKLVLGVKFAIGMTICLSALEIAHMAFLGKWNSEIFAAITGLSGTVMGIFVGQKA
jgi:acetylglutamate kinase